MEKNWVKKDGDKYWPSQEMEDLANVNKQIYKKAEENPISFWEEMASELNWYKEWENAYEEDLPYFKWFLGGKINISYNCLDRHLEKLGDHEAIIWEPEPGQGKTKILTYRELHKEVNKFSNVLKKLGV